MTMATHRVLVDLDCLLDTRLGLLAQHKGVVAEQVVQNRQYHERQRDEFPGVSFEQFKALVKQRNVETLKLSVLTNIFEFLHLVVMSRLQECNEHNEVFSMEVVVNTYPYDLSSAESDAIVQIVAAKLAETVTVKAVRHADGFLTPKYCKDNFQVMVRYWWEEWLACQMKNFEIAAMPQVTVFVPALYEKLPTHEDLQECERMQVKPFQASEKALAPLFALRIIDARLFSIVDVPA